MKLLPQNQPRPVPPRAILIEELLDLSRRLGRTPRLKEVCKNYADFKVHNPTWFVRRFGTWTNALRAAGLPLNYEQEFTREELLEQLRNLAKHLGRRIIRDDVAAARYQHTCANLRTFIKEFGTVHAALVEAGVNQIFRHSKHTRMLPAAKRKPVPPARDMIADLRALAGEFGRAPSSTEIDAAARQKKCVGTPTYIRHYGTVGAAVEAAGLEPVPLKFSPEILLNYLRALAEELGRNPTQKDINDRSAIGDMPSLMSYWRNFGGLRDALRAAKLAPPKLNEQQLKAQLIRELQTLTKNLGHAPGHNEWNEAFHQGLISAPNKFIRAFGSLNDARSEAGVLDQLKQRPRSRRPQQHLTAEDVVQYLRQLARRLDRPPTSKDISQAASSGGPIGLKTINRLLGSMKAARDAAGLPHPQIVAKSDPHHARHYTDEQLLDQLRDLGQKLNKIPSGPDTDAACKLGEAASRATFAIRFGSWNQALLAAGYPPLSRTERQNPISRETLLEELRKLEQSLGHAPSVGEIKAASKRGECPTSMTYLRHFGSIPKARELAGLKPFERRSGK